MIIAYFLAQWGIEVWAVCGFDEVFNREHYVGEV